MTNPGPLDARQQEFIRKNWRTLPIRRMASELGAKRTDIEDFVAALRAAPPPASEPLPLKRELIWLAALCGVAVLSRIYYLLVLEPTPFFGPLSKLLDDGVFDLRGMSIAAGDILGRDWSWLIYNSPLYPYFLGLVYFIAGHSIGTAHVVQTFLGAFTPLLVYFLAKEAFGGRRVPWIAAALALAYVPFLYYENLLAGESLSVFLSLCALLLLVRSYRRESVAWGAIFAAGLLWGVGALLRPHLLIAAVFPALHLAYVWAVERKKRIAGPAAAVLLMAGVAAGISPITLKNYYLLRDFVPISAIGGANLYMSNNPSIEAGRATTTIFGADIKEINERSAGIAEKAVGRPLKPSEVSSYWLGRTIAYIRASPAGFSRLMLRKTEFLFNRYEFPDMRDMLFTAEFVPVLKPSWIEYGVVTALALCGVVLCLPGSSAAAGLLFLFALGYSGSIVIFYVTSRYRLPLVPVFIVFAAAALDRAWAVFTRENRLALSGRRLLAAFAAGLACVFAAGYAVSAAVAYATPPSPDPPALWFLALAAAALACAWPAFGREDRWSLSRIAALGALAAAFVFYPIPQENFSRSYNSLGIFFDETGRYADSKRCYLKALQLDPSFPGPYHNLALHFHYREGDDVRSSEFEKRAQALKDYIHAHGAQDTGL